MKIAIKGHPTRGEEIISLLESLGGANTALSGNGLLCTYYIDDNNVIRYNDAPKDYKVYTLEEFETQFPFKSGDKVIFPVEIGWWSGTITSLTSDFKYQIKTEKHGYLYIEPHKLSLYPMKEERNVTLTLEKAKEWYKKGGELKEIALKAFTEKELIALPRSWKEFCDQYSNINDTEYFIDNYSNIERLNDVVHNHCRLMNTDKNICPSQKSAEAHLAMIQLEQLRDCWRQGWEPDWSDAKQVKFCICYYQGKFKISTLYETRCFLSFPTYEMAKEFLECFRDLIEKAGDLI